MKIESIHIKNLRAFRDQLIDFDDYTCFVGPNGAGKSTVLFALNIFFREQEGCATSVTSLVQEDFYQRNTADPIEITLTFSDLSTAAQEDFKSYYRQQKLIVTAKAVFDPAVGKADVFQFGNRMVMQQFRAYFECKKDGGKVPDLIPIYERLRSEFPDLPVIKTGAGMEDALNAYEAAHPEQCKLSPSNDQFYGVSKGENLLQKYIQWVYVPAVKDVTREQDELKNTALGKLLARTVRSKVDFSERINVLMESTKANYKKILDESQIALSGISESLQRRLVEWSHPDAKIQVSWQYDPDKSVKMEPPSAKATAGEDLFNGELGRFGHGFQRSYFLALLQELASIDNTNQPKLILGCEEPELYQHPPQARHLANVLSNLSGNSQIITTTHSPLFVNGYNFQSIRQVKRNTFTKESVCTAPNMGHIAEKYLELTGEKLSTPSATLVKLSPFLQPQLAEMFFTKNVVFVEGIEDVAYINSWLHLTGRIVEFRKNGCHIIHLDAKSRMLRPAVIAQQMGIPIYIIFDADSSEAGGRHENIHAKDNRQLMNFLGLTSIEIFPASTLKGPNYTIWPNCLGDEVKRYFIASLGEEAFDRMLDEARVMCGQAPDINKIPMFIATWLDIVYRDCKSCGPLDELCEAILHFSRSGPDRDISKNEFVIDTAVA